MVEVFSVRALGVVVAKFDLLGKTTNEKELSRDMSKPEFQEWYKKFIDHVESGEREILKVIM